MSVAQGVPTTIGRYRVEGVIGAGGFATVYLARDDRLDAKVAIKVLAENHCLDPDVRERFLKEGRVLRRIGSPHVVAIHDLGETERAQPYLVLDHADRGTLAARVAARRTEGWVPAAGDLLDVAGALADSLGAVHAGHLVHRDIAPRNLLLRSTRAPGVVPAGELVAADERLLLADLGLSKDLAVASGLTVAGGTAGFTPPEQREGPAHVDARADIWSATAVLVWLLLGETPDDAGRWRSSLAAAGWPPALVDALARGLAQDPDGRFADVASWHAAVREALEPAPEVVAAPVASTPQRWRWLALVAALVLVGVVAAGVLLTGRGEDGPDQTVEELDDGDVRVEATSGELRVGLTGPEELKVGATATFVADTDGLAHWVWFGPDGGIHPDAAELEVEAQSPGIATVRLRGVDGQNREVEVVHRLRVVE